MGGLVPSLLIDQTNLPPGVATHAGTMDLDIGLTMSLLDGGRYRSLTQSLRQAGLSPDVNELGRPTFQRWKAGGAQGVTVDFLIPPSRPDDRGGRLRNIEADFAAVIAPGLQLALEDRERVALSGETILGERVSRSIRVCRPGAYMVLKALASDRRGENKDAYDLYYLLRNLSPRPGDIAARLRPLLGDPAAVEAIAILRRDFLDHDAVGPRRVAMFVTGSPDDDLQADVQGFAAALIRAISGG